MTLSSSFDLSTRSNIAFTSLSEDIHLVQVSLLVFLAGVFLNNHRRGVMEDFDEMTARNGTFIRDVIHSFSYQTFIF